jgi:hypothetical protein
MDDPNSSKKPPGKGWLPVQVAPRDGVVAIEWVYFGARRLTEPFYEGSVRQARADGGAQAWTPLEDLASMPAPPSVPPNGFIFHMSRCGSTLAAQMLAASPANIVVSEASPIDAIVRLDRPAAERARLLRAMIGAFGQIRNPEDAAHIVKLDSWHARALPLFRQAFPDTPWVFLYRNPVEVMVSHVRRTGMQMVSGLVAPDVYGLGAVARPWGEDYFAQVLGAICEAAADGYAAGRGLLVNYDELPAALIAKILPHFGIAPSADQIALMLAAAAFDAKTPSLAYAPDAASKRSAATDAVQTAIERHLSVVYRRLESLRAAG